MIQRAYYPLNIFPVPRFSFTSSMINFLEKNVRGRTWEVLAGLFNERFHTHIPETKIRDVCHSRHLRNGLPRGGQRRGVPHINRRTQSVGAEQVLDKRKGIVFVKISDIGNNHGELKGIWKQKHRLIWEQKYGPIPAGKNIVFLDGNKHNFELNNLALLSTAEVLRMNQYRLWSRDKEVTKTGIAIVRHKIAIRKAQAKLNRRGK